MPYPEPLVSPMREELTRLGVEELRTAADVDRAMEQASEGTTLAVINSVCGCAAANARPAVAMAKGVETQPDRYITVFAGQDLEATARLRDYLVGIPHSSPFMALLKDGDPVVVLERRDIEGRSASAIAHDLVGAFQRFCGEAAGDGAVQQEPVVNETQGQTSDAQPITFRSIL